MVGEKTQAAVGGLAQELTETGGNKPKRRYTKACQNEAERSQTLCIEVNGQIQIVAT